jgi:hypothetical protein
MSKFKIGDTVNYINPHYPRAEGNCEIIDTYEGQNSYDVKFISSGYTGVAIVEEYLHVISKFAVGDQVIYDDFGGQAEFGIVTEISTYGPDSYLANEPKIWVQYNNVPYSQHCSEKSLILIPKVVAKDDPVTETQPSIKAQLSSVMSQLITENNLTAAQKVLDILKTL